MLITNHHAHGAAAFVLTFAMLACSREPQPGVQSETPVLASAAVPAAQRGMRTRNSCAEHFAAFDDDGNQRMSRVEFDFRPHADPDPASVFKGRDADSDGNLSESEFCLGWRGASSPTHARGPGMTSGGAMGFGRGMSMSRRRMGGPMMGMRCEQHFDAFDVSRDGKLTEDEFAAWPHVRGDTETLFDERDRNHDGAIDRVEFCAK